MATSILKSVAMWVGIFVATAASAETPTSQPSTKPTVPVLAKDGSSAASSFTGSFSPPTSTKPDPGFTAGNPYSVSRSNEDYTALNNPANRSDLFWPLKQIRLSKTDPDYFVTFGGEVRERYEQFNNLAFGQGPQDHDGYWLTRLFTDADLHLGRNLRLFVETKSAMIDRRVGGPRATDADEFDVDQAFAELTFPIGQQNKFTVTGGRQYLLYGAQRLVSPLDWSNTRRTFDGAKVSFVSDGGPRSLVNNYFDAFWTRPVAVDKEEFNNDDHATAFWGLYDTLLFPQLMGSKSKSGLDLYFLGLHQKARPAVFASAAVAASNDTYTVGTRFATTPMPWDLDVEADYQFGRVGDAGGHIGAYAFAVDGGYTLPLPLAPRINTGFDIASGDNGTDNPDRQTFNQLFPLSHSYLGWADLLGRENVIDLHPGLTFTLLQNNAIARCMSLRGDYHIFWRQNVHDDLYNAAGGVGRAAAGNTARHVGDEVDLLLNWQFDQHLSSYAGYSHFFTGGFIDQTGARGALDFFYLAVNYTF